LNPVDALILGAGIIGLAIARELAGRGHQVTVLERETPGAGASGAAAGMLAPQAECHKPGPLLELGLASREFYPAWIESIKKRSGLDPEYDPAGTVAIACSSEEAGALEDQAAWQQVRGLPHRLLSRGDLHALLPGLTEAAATGLHFPRDHRVDPRLLCRALATAVAADGVQVKTGVQVIGFSQEAGRVTGVVLNDRELQAPVIVAAAGCWTGLLPAVADQTWPEVPPVRGQMIVLEPEPGSGFGAVDGIRAGGHPAVVSGHGYMVPRRSGLLLFGSTMESAGYEATPTAEGVADLQERAARLYPSLAGVRLAASWAGLRPGSADGLPTIGPWGNTGVLLATGHHRNGILLAPATARLVADLAEGVEPECSLKPFRPGRWLDATGRPAAGSPATPGP
jgi:glycine oxidase